MQPETDPEAPARARLFSRTMQKGADILGLSLPEDAVGRLVAHHGKLGLWASKTNLTALQGREEMVEGLYLDSAVMLPYLTPGQRLHDVGTGAGFPGLVLKGLLPGLEVVLSEARQKKVAFLRQAARAMGVEAGLEIRCETVGEGRWPERLAEEVVSKAAFPPEEWLRLGQRLVRPGGRLWFYLSQRVPLELPLGWREELFLEYSWPFSKRKKILCALRAAG